MKKFIILISTTLLSLFYGYSFANNVNDEWNDAKWIAMEDVDTIVPYGIHLELGAKRILGERKIGMYRLPQFRKLITLQDKKVKNATALVCGLGHFNFYINGIKVGNHFLDPGWTKYDKEVEYVSFDVTNMLKPDKNVLGVILGNGFYNIPRERYFKLTNSFGVPKLKFSLKIEYTDGTTEWLVSDRSWKCIQSPITYSSIYGGEDYDGRLEQKGWMEDAQFDDSQWETPIIATVKDKQGFPLPYSIDMKPQDGTALIEHSELSAVKCWKNAAGKWEYDFGQNCSGYVQYTIKSQKEGQIVIVTPSELILENGCPNLRIFDDCGQVLNPDSLVYWKYITSTNPEATVKPLFHYYGFRYAQIDGAVPEGQDNPDNLPVISNVKCIHTTNEMAEVGSFHCSKELFNKIHDLIDWAIRSNAASVITDCPTREKLGWQEQYHLMQYSLMYRYDMRKMYKKAMSDLRASQRKDGCIPSIEPEYVRFAGGFEDTPEWGSSVIISPWYYYKWYGDDSLLREYYPQMKRYLNYLTTKADKHIIDYGLGDWFDIGPNRPGVAQLTPVALSATAMYYYDITIMQQIAELLGYNDDAQQFDALGKEVKRAFNENFHNDKEGGYCKNSQTGNAMALFMGLSEDDRTYKNIIKDIEKRHYALTTGDIGFRYLVRVLSQGGSSDVIYKMNTKEDTPGYAWQINQGATALTESWQAYDYVSNNHIMLGHIMEWFYSELGGIRQQDCSVGFKHILIDPQIVGDVTCAQTSLITQYGKIICDWNLEADKYTLKITVPSGADAIVALPHQYGTNICNNGMPISQDANFRLVENSKVSTTAQSDKIYYSVPAGTYNISITK